MASQPPRILLTVESRTYNYSDRVNLIGGVHNAAALVTPERRPE